MISPTVLNFYQSVREQYPEIAQKADAEHIRIWGEIDPDYTYSWFESLAKAVNTEMAEPAVYKELFLYISRQYQNGSREIKDCIDVAFVENLFWRLPPEKIAPYWKYCRTICENFT